MEFRDLKHQYRLHKKEIDNAIQSVLINTNFIQGNQVSALEELLAEYVGVRHCITCANGTDALQLALMTWNIGAGDAVFVPDFTFFSSGEVVSLLGATPIFVDIDEDTYNINPQCLEQAIQYVLEKTNLNPRVVIAVDLFGQPADFKQIKEIAEKYNLLILEDGAQGFGGKIGTKKACSFGDIATTSFFPAKPLGCYGDGGAVFTENDEWAELIRSYCIHGKGIDKYDNVRIGINSRLDTLQAAVLLEKLKFFDQEIKKCNQIAEMYTKDLKGCIKVPIVKEGYFSSWAQYTICFQNNEEREQAIKKLKENDIPTAVYYRKPMHQQSAFIENKDVELEYTVTEKICERCLSLPMHSYLSVDETERVIKKVETIYTRR